MAEKTTGGRLMAEMLQAENVEHVFGIIDGTYLMFFASCAELDMDIITPRHEATAMHAAGAYARMSGRLGVAMASNGPGVANVLSGVAVEQGEGNRVLLITSSRRPQIAYPDRQCVAFVGDGGFSMLMGEFLTAVKYRLPIKVIIIKNNVLGQIKWEQMVFLGNPEYGVELEPMDYAAFAEAAGGTGFTIEDPADCGDMLREALSVDGPVVVQAVVDPLEPPMPAEISADQALKFAESLAKGQPQRLEIAGTVLEDTIKNLT